MILAEACVHLQELGHLAMQLHRDHLCAGAWSHRYDQCPRAPWHAHSAQELAPVESVEDLQALVERKAIAFHALVGAPVPEPAP
jgi:hypothetical protein